MSSAVPRPRLAGHNREAGGPSPGLVMNRPQGRGATALPQEPVDLYFPGDDLFTPFDRRRGLPIGNLTSQLFGNLYLDRLDHDVTEVLRAPYLRYLDDFALFDDDPARLVAWQQASGWPAAESMRRRPQPASGRTDRGCG